MRPRSTIRMGASSAARSRRGSDAYTTRSAGAALLETGKAEPLADPSMTRRDHVGLRNPRSDQRADLIPHQAMRQWLPASGPGEIGMPASNALRIRSREVA